ncbi:phospholipase D family protein [Pontiella sulfatireligans]|uniref:Cardiolipin synthase C n=1 Tax=Pontiella sulfatireligans TaxID=2750658 RepID=A0A6C2UNE6_9BACT|nr:phospholipase D family protein [Pontiella sulfatireligans]VGO21463.1 Cardiolipin synthase C [Pontiella sulfatireligans]
MAGLIRSAQGMRIALLSSIAMGLTACSTIPKNPHKPVSHSLQPAKAGMLIEHSQTVMAKAADGESAFMMIPQNSEALRWRLALIDHAKTSIDLQVFIWSNDESGRLMLSHLLAAAKRGVQIRLLVDDLPKDWSDMGTALVARQDNIQLRRFNPGRVRKGAIRRTLQMGLFFKKLNRRMHNKQMLVDGQWGLVGGRNLGNPYFGLSKKYNNRDLDLLITGAVIGELGADFDLYWNSDAAYPGESMVKKITESKKEKLFQKFNATLKKDRHLLSQTNLPTLPADWSAVFAPLPERMVYGTAQCIQDSPNVKGDRGERLIDQFRETGIMPHRKSCIITPYMIPSQKQLDHLANAVKEEDRKVRVLVPSMESNNHTMAHSHYKKYRKKLLKAGAELYEFRGDPSASFCSLSDTPPVKSDFISLHTKAFVLDKEWVLIGSLNFDPRSIEINTEHLLLINSPELATQLFGDFETMISPENAWAVTLNEKGKLRWTSSDDERTNQPARGFGQRCADFIYRWLPIEGQL